MGYFARLLSLVFFPYATLIPYAIYVSLTRARNEEVKVVLDAVRKEFTDPAVVRELHSPLPYALPRLSSVPILRHNRIGLLVNGTQTFDRIFATVDAAKRYVLVEFFIIRHDRLGTRFKELLIKKSRQGVRVCVLYDELGSLSIGGTFLREMRSAGIETSAFGTTKGWRNRFQLSWTMSLLRWVLPIWIIGLFGSISKSPW